MKWKNSANIIFLLKEAIAVIAPIIIPAFFGRLHIIPKQWVKPCLMSVKRQTYKHKYNAQQLRYSSKQLLRERKGT